jgi:hypothetical protein
MAQAQAMVSPEWPACIPCNSRVHSEALQSSTGWRLVRHLSTGSNIGVSFPCRWPAGCDVERCKAKLWTAFTSSRRHATTLLVLRHAQHALPFAGALLTRLGSAAQHALVWLRTAPLGHVHFHAKDQSQSYARTAALTGFHSFGTVAGRKEVLTPGETHVSVGFLDLGGLAAACVAGWDEADGGNMEGGVLQWVGYEASPYCVAKTEVVAEMMRGGVATDHILQVCTLCTLLI